MEEKHWIEWIELIADAQIYRQYLKAGDLSEATFVMEADEVEARYPSIGFEIEVVTKQISLQESQKMANCTWTYKW